MTDLAAHIVDRVIPRVPVRQWVLSLPHEFRYRIAYDHERMRAVFGLFVRAVMGLYKRKAKARVRAAETGAITFVQRFGSAANLHVHAHVLVTDGVFTAADGGELRFHELPPPSDDELRVWLATVRRRVLLHLGRHGWLDGTEGDADAIADGDGRVLLQLKTPRSDGTTHLAYDPLDFMAKLAAPQAWCFRSGPNKSNWAVGARKSATPSKRSPPAAFEAAADLRHVSRAARVVNRVGTRGA